MSAFVWQAKESRRAAHSRKKEQRVIKTQDAEYFFASVTAGVEPPPVDLLPATACGDFERSLSVPDKCMGMLIGKKGENLKAIEQKWKVSVKLEKDEKSGEQTVLVTGQSPAEVESAARELDYSFHRIEVPAEMAGWVCGKGGRHFRLVRELSGVALLNLCSEGGEADPGRPEESVAQKSASAGLSPEKRCWIELKGLRDTVENARICLEAHMSYYSVFQEMDEVEARLDQDINEARRNAGWRPKSSSSSGGQTDDRGAQGQKPERTSQPQTRSKSPRTGKTSTEVVAPVDRNGQSETGRVWQAASAVGGSPSSGRGPEKDQRAAPGRERGQGPAEAKAVVGPRTAREKRS